MCGDIGGPGVPEDDGEGLRLAAAITPRALTVTLREPSAPFDPSQPKPLAMAIMRALALAVVTLTYAGQTAYKKGFHMSRRAPWAV